MSNMYIFCFDLFLLHLKINSGKQNNKFRFGWCESMKNKRFWWVLFVIGMVPFVAPFIGFVYEMINSSSWTLVDWLLLYSFVYWPTYIVGIILMVISAYKLRK